MLASKEYFNIGVIIEKCKKAKKEMSNFPENYFEDGWNYGEYMVETLIPERVGYLCNSYFAEVFNLKPKDVDEEVVYDSMGNVIGDSCYDLSSRPIPPKEWFESYCEFFFSWVDDFLKDTVLEIQRELEEQGIGGEVIATWIDGEFGLVYYISKEELEKE